MKTRSEALRDASRVVAEIAQITALLTPREAAERAWRPDGPSIDDLTAQIADGRERLAA